MGGRMEPPLNQPVVQSDDSLIDPVQGTMQMWIAEIVSLVGWLVANETVRCSTVMCTTRWFT